MFKKTVTYTGFDDVEKTEDFYFHLTQAELLEMGSDNTLLKRMQDAAQSQDAIAIMRAVENMVKLSYGVRWEGGNSFQKSPELTAQFAGSPAYDALIMELLTTPDAGLQFMTDLMPKNMREQMKAEVAKITALPAVVIPNPFKDTDVVHPAKPVNTIEEDSRPAWLRERREPTKTELRLMSRPEMQLVFKMRRELAAEKNTPLWLREKRMPTENELIGMDDNEYALMQKSIQQGAIEL